MDLYEAIEKRRTIRVFKEKATEEQIKKLLSWSDFLFNYEGYLTALVIKKQ